MNPSEAKKAKRRKNKKCEPSKAVGNHGKLIIDATISLPDEKILNTNQSPNSEAISKIEQMMDSGDDPLPTMEMSQEANPYFNGDKCLICHREKGALSAPPPPPPAPTNCKSVSIWDLTYDISMLSQLQLWVCPGCRLSMEERKRDNDDLLKLNSDIDLRIPMTELENSTSLPLAVTNSQEGGGAPTNLCQCQTCMEQRELENEQEREAFQLHQYWSEIRLAVRQIYQESGIGCSEEKSSVKPPSLEKIKKMIHTLCLRSPHQLFLWLESQGRELVIEMKISLLKQLGNGTKTPQQAKAFVTNLLDDYAKLCTACKKLHPILLELEQDHLKTLGLSWELVNRHLFQNLVYSDHRLQNALPCLITQLRSSVGNENEEKQLKALLHKYLLFDEQMTIVAAMWREADPFIQEFNIEQAAIKSKQRILHADWELFKMQHKILEQQMMKKADVSALRCTCEDCTLQYMLTCGLLPHHDPTSQPAPDLGMMQDANGHYLPNNFLSSMMNNMDSLDSVLCSAPPSTGLCLSKVKEHWCGSLAAMPNGTTTNLKSPNVMEEETRLWVHPFPTISNSPALTPPPSALDVQACDDDDDDDEGDDEDDDDDDDDEDDDDDDDDDDEDDDDDDDDDDEDDDDDDDDDLPLIDEEVTAEDIPPCTACSTGNQDCQCHHCASTGNSAAISAEKPGAEHPCECHVCVHHVDRAIIPTVVNVPPRPAALSLYPHIHGSNGTDILHNPHLFKPFLHPQLYGLHLPRSKNPFASNLFEANSTAAVAALPPPPLLSDHAADTYRGSHDWDIVYENAKMLLNSRKYNEVLPAPVVSTLEEAVKPVESANMEASEDAHVMPDLVTTHSNKATQASGPLPFPAGYPQVPLDFNHLKHNHASLPSACATTALHEQDGTMPPCLNECRHKANLPYGGRPGAGAVKTPPLHPCLAGHHGQPSLGGASKHPCKDFVFNLPETPESPLSICPNKDGENSHADTEESIDDSCSEQSSSTSTSNQKDSKHCDCCYCEVFGHDVTALPPMSRNYPEMREKLRQRLNRKKMDCKNEENVTQTMYRRRFHKTNPKPLEDCRDLDSLISFINGSMTSENEDSTGSSNKLSSTKVLKKSVKKKKKVDPIQSKMGGDRDDLRKEVCCNSPLDKEADRLDPSCTSYHPIVAGNNPYYSKTEHQCTLAAQTIFTATQGTTASVIKRVTSPATQTSTADCAKITALPVKPEVKRDCTHRCKSENGHSQGASLSEDGISKQIPKCCLSPEISSAVKSNGDSSEASSEVTQLQPATPSSNTLPQSSSPTMAKERVSKKKRKATSQLPSSLSSSTSSSSSGISSCSSSWSASKDGILCLAPHFQQLQITIADSKRNTPSPQAAPIKQVGEPSPTLLNATTDAAPRINTPPSSPVLPKLICNGGEKGGPKNRLSPVANKVPVESRTNVITSNSVHAVSTESPIKPKPRREERKKSDPVPNYLQASAKNKLGGGNFKVNVKIASNGRDTCPSPGKTVGKNKRNKKKGGSAGDSAALEDVFVPRDIDLDNGELDEMEREVEAFKRFCWDSKPLANKEKVNVNLKDIMVRKKAETALECI